LERNDSISKELDKISKDNNKREEQLKKYAEENENLRRFNDLLRNEITAMKTDLDKKDNEISVLSQKLFESDREKLVMILLI
jgi:cell division protein FtsB